MMVSSLSTFAQKDTIFITRVDTVYITKTDTVYVDKSQMPQAATSSATENVTSVPYAKARNYFFRNDAQQLVYPVITDKQTFERYFGMATTMGEQGQPTAIDFDRQFVIATILPATDVNTRVEPVKLSVNDKQMNFAYAIVKGTKMTSLMVPSLLLVVDRQYLRNDFRSSSSVRHESANEIGTDNELIMEINPDDYKNQVKTLQELDQKKK